MRNLKWGLPVVAVACLAVGIAQSSTPALLAGFQNKMNEAQSLKVEFTLTPIGGTPAVYTAEFAKPNKLRVDGPTELIVADGTTISRFNKTDKTWFADPQTPELLAEVMAAEGLSIWAPFFDKNALNQAVARSGQTRNRRGMTLREVEAQFGGGLRTVNYWFSEDNLARQAEIRFRDRPNERLVFDVRSIAVGQPTTANAFAFRAPEGARELSLEERTAAKWYDSIEEALTVARRTNRMVLVHFTATWCGPCRMIERDVYAKDEFKAAAGRSFVLAKIDIDENPDIARQYQVSAVPNIKFLSANGDVVHEHLGYVPLDRFLAIMDEARARAVR